MNTNTSLSPVPNSVANVGNTTAIIATARCECHNAMIVAMWNHTGTAVEWYHDDDRPR